MSNMHRFKACIARASGLLMVTVLLLLASGCDDGSDSDYQLPPEEALLMNHLQSLGTHNSYHIQPKADTFELLLAFIPDVAPTLEYTHIPLQQQFETQGIRQIELDIFHDPNGGLYSEHQARTLFGEDADDISNHLPELLKSEVLDDVGKNTYTLNNVVKPNVEKWLTNINILN